MREATTTKRALFLDDSEDRWLGFRRQWAGAGGTATWVQTASECIEALRSNSFDVICLDHDLGGEVYVDEAEENTGSGVVRWILQERPALPPILIHSWNLPAAVRMASDLISAGYKAHLERFDAGHTGTAFVAQVLVDTTTR